MLLVRPGIFGESSRHLASRMLMPHRDEHSSAAKGADQSTFTRIWLYSWDCAISVTIASNCRVIYAEPTRSFGPAFLGRSVAIPPIWVQAPSDTPKTRRCPSGFVMRDFTWYMRLQLWSRIICLRKGLPSRLFASGILV